MEKLISHNYNTETVPDSYVLPSDSRPGNVLIPFCNKIPTINLGDKKFDRETIVHQIINASQEFGFFQLINHGISEELMEDVLNLAKEFFALPDEDKVEVYSDDPKQSCRLHTSMDYDNEEVHYWKDSMRQLCFPLEEHIQVWPKKPNQYREVVGKFSKEARELSLRLLDLIREGLKLEPDYFNNELTKTQLVGLNHYPPCPDPSLTLGLPKHSDVNIITLLLQGDIPGLQVLIDEQWLAIEPIPNAFVVNIGCTLKIISNGKLKSAEHRVVTNEKVARTTVASFIHPSSICHIEPAEAQINDACPQLYRSFVYKDFVSTSIPDIPDRKPALDRYKLQS